MQRERIRTPYPWTWEIPAAATCLLLTGMTFGIQVGRTLSNVVAGAGLTWPASDPAGGGATVPTPSPIGVAFWTSLPGILAGDASAGLAPPLPSERPADLAEPWLVWASVAATELLVLAATAWACVQYYLRRGPGHMHGMASRAQAEQLLGLRRIQRVAALVRPDLYGPSTRRPEVLAVVADPMALSASETRPPEPAPWAAEASSPWLRRRERRGQS